MINYCYYHNFLFKTVDGQEDYYICPKYNKQWMEVDDFAIENGIYPRNSFNELSEEQALNMALRLGMDKEKFYE